MSIQPAGVDWELPRNKVKVIQQLGIGEFGPIYDAEVRLEANFVSRALVKVCIVHLLPVIMIHDCCLLSVFVYLFVVIVLQVFSQGTSQDLVRFRDDIAALM